MSEITNMIRVEPESVLFPHTYISAISRITIKIINDSNTNIHFEWRKYSSKDQENTILNRTDTSSIDERQKFGNMFMFSSPIFTFVPEKGEIWANRSQDFLINFTPDLAKTFDDTAYLYVVETGQRIPLPLHGSGLPPDARFDIDAINIGHVALESILEYKVTLQNVGQVGVDFSIEKKKNNDMLFEFSPDRGHIPIDQQLEISVKFTANAVGSFSEVFTFLIKGATQFHPTLTLYGRVIGPSFVLSTKAIDFGTMSFGFLYSQTFEIENKSHIPFDYTLRFNQDGSFARREFTLTPTTGTVGKFTKQLIKLEFIPISIKKYNVELHFDIAKFGISLAKIPITANCICPVVKIENPQIDLGNLFIGHPYKSSINIIDQSEYPAKYEFVPSNDTSQLQAKTQVVKPSGTIEPLKTAEFLFTIFPIQLGPIAITQYIRIYGSDDPPLPFVIKAVCTGPNIILSSKEINFNSVQLLKDVSYLLKMQNKSLIPAIFTANVSCPEGGFKVSPNSGEIAPNGTFEISVSAYLDDNVQFTGKLNLLFENLNPIPLDIKALGVGSPIVASVNMTKINLGYIFSERPVVKKIIFDNKGRKAQEIRWIQQKPRLEGSNNATFTFHVNPDQQIIEPHSETEFNFVFQCSKPASFTLNLQCNTTQKRKRIDLFTPEFSGTFVSPEIKVSKKEIEFKHVHDVKMEEELSYGALSPLSTLLKPMDDSLQITNQSKLPLHVIVDCPQPFSSDVSSFDLDLGQTGDLKITFDPTFKQDFISETILRKLTFSFQGHPQKNMVNLRGNIVFPNLKFSPSDNLNFGILMMNTEQSKDVEITNVGELPSDFEWQLLPNQNGIEISKIFDIYPIRAHLEPGEKGITRFSFFSMSSAEGKSARYEGTAVCHVVGGPEYTMNLKGGSAVIQYKIDPLHIDLGQRNFKEVMTQTLSLQNMSDAPINFSIKIPRSCQFQKIEIDPNDGQLAIGASTKINVSITCGLPMKYNESFFVQIGHFDEVRVDVDVTCFIPQVRLSLSRLENDPLSLSFRDHNKNIVNVNPTEEELAAFDSKMFIQRMTEHLSLTQTAIMKSQPRRRKKKPGDNSHFFDGHVSSRYLVDMGRIVFGKIEKTDFTIKNITPFAISFDIFPEVLNGSGFTMNPVSFQDIPSQEEIIITIAFDNQRRTSDILGDVEFELPIVFADDLGSMVHLRANLSMPILSFSNMHFNFGNVIVGQSRILTLQLQNMNTVPCEFVFSEAQFTNVLQRSMSQGTAPVFTAAPSSGLLPPSSFRNIEITFSPRGDKNYSMQFPIAIKHNKQQTFLTMRGYGVRLKVIFDPPELLMPPINPYSDPSLMEVNLINPTDYPIEVMAPQFDLQLLIDILTQKNAQAALLNASTTSKTKQQLKQEQKHQQKHNSEQVQQQQNSENDQQNSGITNDQQQQQNSDQQNASCEENSITHVPLNSSVSKFSICVIISGPMICGKTTVAKMVSEYLNNVPIISLKEVWKEIIENPESTPDDYINALSNVINVGDCAEGFIIDGLDGLHEPPETDQFVQHSIKSKNTDTTKNPFLVIPHSTPTSSEQALTYVLSALDGHYVFHVALRAAEEQIVERNEKIIEDDKKEKLVKAQKAKEDLFMMTEEQYLALTEEEQEEVDKKRQNVRKNLLKSAMEYDELNKSKDKKRSSSSSRRKSHRSSSSKAKEEDNSKDKKHRKHKSKTSNDEKPPEKEEKKPASSSTNENAKESTQSKRKRGGMPTDPIPKSILYFKYTLGTIVQKIQANNGSFQVIDPVQLMAQDVKKNDSETPLNANANDKSNVNPNLNEKSNPSTNEKSGKEKAEKSIKPSASVATNASNKIGVVLEEEGNPKKHRKHKKSNKKISGNESSSQLVTKIEEEENETLVTKLANPAVNEEEDIGNNNEEEEIEERALLPSFAIQNMNTLLIDIGPTPQEINNAILKFLPNIHQLEEKAFTRLIPPPRMIMPVTAPNRKLVLPQMPQFFQIIGEEVVEDAELSADVKTRPDSHQKAGRKSRVGKQPKTNDPSKAFLDEIDTSKQTQRWLIEAKSSKTLTIQFDAQLIGLYKDIITFQLVNGKSDTFKLNVSGECSYPDIERSIKIIFPKRVNKLDGKTDCAYAMDVNEFHFGSLLVVKEKGKTAHYRQSIILQNVSHFPVEFTSFLIDKQPPWYLETNSAIIDVDQSFQLFFGVSPTVPNLYRNQLYLLLKDHPEPLCFNIVAEGCAPIIDCNDTSLDFEKMLLNQTKTLRLDFRNTGKLPAFWRLKNTNVLGDNFQFSALEGTLNPRGFVGVSVTYSSPKPVNVKKSIVFEVLDSEKARVFITKQITIIAESFDVNFDFQYPKGLDHLQFGSMKVGQQKAIACNLVNKGKYVTNFKFSISSSQIQKLFSINPMEGSLNPGKPMSVNFNFISSALCKYKNCKGIILTIIDNLTKTTTTTLTIPFSIESFYSSFIIAPNKQEDFGAIPVNTSVNKTLTINNNGVFPFEFEISGKADQIVQPTVVVTKKSKPTPQKARGGPKKGSDKAVQIGSFALSPSTGTIQPGATQNIDMEFYCGLPGKSKATALISISECNPQNANGVNFKLAAESFIPGISVTDYEHIFQGTHLCLRYDLQKLNRNAFLEDELILHFAPLILQQKSSVDVYLINPFPIPCSADVTVTPKQKMGKNTFPYEINVKSVDIPPNSSKPVQLNFNPVICDKFIGIFEAIVRGGTNPETRSLKFQIEGTGTLPVVSVITQLDNKSKSNNYSINLGRTLIGFTKEKTIALKNEGLIPTRLSITAKASPDFELEGFDSVQETTLECDHLLNLPVIFAPQKPRKDQFDIAVAVLDNPKASISFSFIGEGFTEDIIFEGLSEEENDLNFRDNIVGRQQTQTFRMRNVTTEDIRFTWMFHGDFTFMPKNGHLRKGTSKEISVIFISDKPVKHNGVKVNCQWSKITLNSPDAPDWDDTMKLIKYVPKSSLVPDPLPSPVVEDTKPKRSQRNVKSRNAKTKNTNSLTSGKNSQQLSTTPPPNHLSQQSQQQQLSANNNNITAKTGESNNNADDEIVKVVTVKPEPTYQSQFAKPRDLILKINAISDYIKYQIDTAEISFMPTMMFQTRFSDVKVTNPTSIRFEYSWIILNFHSLRTSYAATRRPPFSVQPSTGYVEAFQTVTFKVKFHPEEVDDFTADIRMEIPFLAAMEPPTISVSAFSRRPLCHFNVEMSDYLSAGRRHPDYTDSLPTDIKVIELFSPVVGSKRYKRFEIINPTSSPYEIQWILKSNPENCPIECDTPNAFISSGKRYSVSFSYAPTSVKTVEILWDFVIPEHGVTIPFLTVGRIMPNNK